MRVEPPQERILAGWLILVGWIVGLVARPVQDLTRVGVFGIGPESLVPQAELPHYEIIAPLVIIKEYAVNKADCRMRRKGEMENTGRTAERRNRRPKHSAVQPEFVQIVLGLVLHDLLVHHLDTLIRRQIAKRREIADVLDVEIFS